MTVCIQSDDPRLVVDHASKTGRLVSEQSRSWRNRAALVFHKFFKKTLETSDVKQSLTLRDMNQRTGLRGQHVQPKWESPLSVASYHTATVGFGEPPGYTRSSRYLQDFDEYAQLLQSQKLWPVDPLLEQNWSGRGQHAEFKKDEQKLIDELLEVQDNLGTTRTAFVQSVKCRRILLARKTILCGKQTMTKQEAVAEVAHLTQLNHAHIVRVIGTYVKGRELSILLYPVADCNLEGFIEHYREMRLSRNDPPAWETFLRSSFSCLSSAVRYIHRNLTKHMDIKPQNILVLHKGQATFALFIADFGIARSYAKLEEVETDGRTSFTRRYAAPEVVRQEQRGLPADIFSLGCVFVEVYDALFKGLAWYQRGAGLQACLDSDSRGDTSYHANIDALQADLSNFTILQGGCDVPCPSLIIEMLRHDADERPSAEELVLAIGERSCCITGSVALQAVAKEPPEFGMEAS